MIRYANKRTKTIFMTESYDIDCDTDNLPPDS